jgi:hypothetical protein
MTMQPIAGFDLYASQKGAGMLGGMAEQEAQREWSKARNATRAYQLYKTGQLQGQAVAEQGKANAFSTIVGSLGSAIGSLAGAGIKQAQAGGQSSSGGGSNSGGSTNSVGWNMQDVNRYANDRVPPSYYTW